MGERLRALLSQLVEELLQRLLPLALAHANTFRESDPGRIDGLLVGAISIRVPSNGYVYVVDMTRGLLIYREP